MAQISGVTRLCRTPRPAPHFTAVGRLFFVRIKPYARLRLNRWFHNLPDGVEERSVNTKGNFRRPPYPELDVADCNIKFAHSRFVKSNAKSEGNRFLFLLIC